MVREINGEHILDSDIETIRNIFNARSYNDYYADLGTHFRSNLVNIELLKNKAYTIYLGDDWYFIIKKGLLTIELEEMIASINTTPKRNAEMLKVIREVILKYKNFRFTSSLRHDTTYKLFDYLRKNDYVKVYRDRIYSIDPNLDRRDQTMEKVKYFVKLEESEYKYIMHEVIFRLNKKFKEKKLC